MMRRLPILSTIVVLLAVTAMIGLGIWQLQRRSWKEALIARYAAAATLQPVDFPAHGPVDPAVLFRRSAAHCPAVASWAAEAGRGTSGKPGWRHIATCDAPAGQIPVRVDVGVSNDPGAPRWAGGTVIGTISWAPQHSSLLGRSWGGEGPRDPMIVADHAAPGLEASTPPSAADIPNNHLSYAFQWFFFAATALVIYGIALRRRMIAERERAG